MADGRISVRLAGEEMRLLTELAGARGLSRAGVVRALLRESATRPAPLPGTDEALTMLANSARAGSVPARVTLARLLTRREAQSPVQARLDGLAARRRARA